MAEGQWPFSDSEDVSSAGHWPLKMETKRTCRKKGCKCESRYICTACSDVVKKKYVHLCIMNRNCFYEHHTQEDRDSEGDVSGAGHFPLKIEAKRTCRKKGCKGESRYICTGCSDVAEKKYVHLCIMNRNCFYEHHTQEDC